MHKILFYNKFVIRLYMFPALLCTSSGGQNCITQDMVSSHPVGGRPVHRFSNTKLDTQGLFYECCLFGFQLRPGRKLLISTEISLSLLGLTRTQLLTFSWERASLQKPRLQNRGCKNRCCVSIVPFNISSNSANIFIGTDWHKMTESRVIRKTVGVILKRNVNKNPTDPTACRYLFTAKLLYMFRVSQHPSSGVLKTVSAATGTGHTTCNSTPSQRGLIGTGLCESSGCCDTRNM